MKLYNQYLNLKDKNLNICYIFKVGIFYILLDEDCNKYSQLLGLKKTHLNEKVYKCGFPINSSDKYFKLLKQNKIKYKIIEKDTLANENNKSLDKLLLKIKNIDVNKITGIEALELITQIQKYL